MKRALAFILALSYAMLADAQLPSTGPLSLKQIATEFNDPGTGGSGNYTSALTYGTSDIGSLRFIGYSTSAPSIGSFAGGTPTTDDGKTIVRANVFCTVSGGVCGSNTWSYRLSIGGFSSNPSSRYVNSLLMFSYSGNNIAYSVTSNVTSGNCGTSCDYQYSSGIAQWTWGAYAAPQPYEHFPTWFAQPHSIVITGTAGSGGYTVPSQAVWLYKNGGYVPNISCNSSVPTSGPIKFSNFYGACRVP